MTPKELICHYSQIFHRNGWCPGMSGSIALQIESSPVRSSVIVTPENIPRDEIKSGDLFEFRSDYDSQLLIPPARSNEDSPHVIAGFTEIFLHLFSTGTGIRCAVEICSLPSILAARVALKIWEKNADSFPDRVRLSAFQQLGAPSEDLIIPVLEIRDVVALRECLTKEMRRDSKLDAALLKGRGLLVWGNSLPAIKARIETLEQLFKLYISHFGVLSSQI